MDTDSGPHELQESRGERRRSQFATGSEVSAKSLTLGGARDAIVRVAPSVYARPDGRTGTGPLG